VAYILTHADLVEKLQSQLGLFERSAKAYDRGYEDEAYHLATSIRVLMHDTGASHSLLGQLGVKDTLAFMDTAAPINPANLATTPGLVVVKMESDPPNPVVASYAAPLGILSPRRKNRPKPFAPWWNDAVTKDSQGASFARRDYALTIANKEGSGHVDPLLKEDWANLTRDNTLGWKVKTSEGDERSAGSPALGCVRQIAYEVDQTLRTQLSYLL
jgi:hypothetical protein